ncbi:MarR family winged helix-turn-helix transcriptional regulator [Citricoccus nitrophenolicus]|uniref:MarR family winged helix-turn-helix transcriptional regulator n=1 Tax=Citricoccus nitrophenolicus TaxID=863575 RepID=UPI003371994F
MDPVTETVDEARDAGATAETGLEGVRWLSSQERRAWLTLVATHMQLMPTLEADLQLEGAVSFFEYQVLAMLSESDDALPMSELAARTNASLSRLSHVARKLESRGLMARSPSSEDARVTMAKITEVGMAEIARLAPFHVASVRARFLDSLDDQDLADMGRIGAKILAHLDPDHWVFRDPALADDRPQQA